MLTEMIRNLLSNAIRYTDKGRILLGCRQDGDNVRIEVWDSGVGITQDDLPHIFHEYYQGTDSAARGGFGLGLAIVKRLEDAWITGSRCAIPEKGRGSSLRSHAADPV